MTSQGTRLVAGGDDQHRGRWTIDYDHYIDALYVGSGYSNSSFTALLKNLGLICSVLVIIDNYVFCTNSLYQEVTRFILGLRRKSGK